MSGFSSFTISYAIISVLSGSFTLFVFLIDGSGSGGCDLRLVARGHELFGARSLWSYSIRT